MGRVWVVIVYILFEKKQTFNGLLKGMGIQIILLKTIYQIKVLSCQNFGFEFNESFLLKIIFVKDYNFI